MNVEIKERWVAALRSGDYKQNRHFLRVTDDSFCCLGVLCDLHSKETGEEWHFNESGYYLYLNSGGILSPEVIDWAGLSSQGVLIAMNDSQEFNTIAEYIETNL